ncbi:hypothetical protein L228DRAFT_244500, partial [Xylona heveae TC161]
MVRALAVLGMAFAAFATQAAAQEAFQYYLYPQGSDCDHGEQDSQIYEVTSSAQCVPVGQSDYDIEVGFVVLGTDAINPPVYACPNSACDSGCTQLSGEGSGGGRTGCTNISNGPYLKVDGVTG